MTIKQREAAKAGVNLSLDAEEGGYTKNTTIIRTDKRCPRCRGRVSKEKRKCLDCSGKLLWDGDDGAIFNKNMDYWFMWHKPAFGIQGWYSKDYWDSGANQIKY